jgi:hypothetical protein
VTVAYGTEDEVGIANADDLIPFRENDLRIERAFDEWDWGKRWGRPGRYAPLTWSWSRRLWRLSRRPRSWNSREWCRIVTGRTDRQQTNYAESHATEAYGALSV